MVQTLLQRYGRGAVARIVSDFYRDVLSSPQLSPYFADVSMSGLVTHQTAFLEAAMGGPPSYTPQQIREAHSSLGIGPSDFAEMIRLLESTMSAGGIEPLDIEPVLTHYRSFEPDVVIK